MKRFSTYIICCSLMALFACTHDDIELPQGPVGDGKITIKASLDDMAITRAVDDSQVERTITHIDVFAVNMSDGDEYGQVAYYERNTVGNNGGSALDGAGSLTLNIARRAKDANNQDVFTAGASYSFYLVANSTLSEEEMRAATTLRALEVLVQDDSFDPDFATYGSADGPSHDRQTLLHLTGTKLGENPDFDTPQTFLMDATATDTSNLTKWVVNPTTGTVNDLVLEAEFKRAAAKIIVNITQGPDVEFHTELNDAETGVPENAQYDFYKLPSSTLVLSSDSKLVGIKLINTAPMKPNAETFKWASEEPAATNSIQIVGYAYAHSWSDIELTNETSLILNIPMKWNEDDDDNHTKESVAARSWYKVPLSQAKSFERNKCYVVNIEINATGAKTKSTAIQLRDIEYQTLDWVGVDLSVGENSNNPEYLMLNTDLVEMYNTNFDSSSLKFSSSSPIVSVTLKDVYAHDVGAGMFTLGTDNGYDAYYLNKYNAKTKLPDAVRKTISASAEADELEGGINILSPILNTTDEQRKLAIAALGNEPIVPSEPNTSGMPDPDDYLGLNKDYRTYDELPTANYSNRNTEYTIYRYNAEKETFQSATYKCIFSYDNYTYSWELQGDWVDIDPPATYTTALNEWIAQHPEYAEYYNAKQKYDAYQAAVKAINASANVGETHYNTIRYLEFEVKNEQGLTATFRVMQYPTIFITNAVGWYSYREDFKNVNSSSHATTYHIKGDRIGGISYNKGTYTLNDGSSSSSSFWRSKVSASPEPSHQGTATWNYYYWSSNGSSPSTKTGTSSENTRMYNIKVTTTSKDYIIGVPRRVNVTQEINYNGTVVKKTYDTTDSSIDNKVLVSPSFMTASRLGVVTTSNISYSSSSGTDARETEMYNLFSYHCSNYVEVKQVVENGVTKKVVYDDWRLPTEAEIGIIIALQPTSSGNNSADKAIDYLLNAGYYYSASGPVKNNNNETSISVRCVRDAVDEPKAKSLTEGQNN